MSYSRATASILKVRAEPARPALMANCCVLTCDAMLGDQADANVLVLGSPIVGGGPGLASLVTDNAIIVFECRCCVLAPFEGGCLMEAEFASIAVIGAVDLYYAPVEPRISGPGHVDILLADGCLFLWQGSLIENVNKAGRLKN